MAGSSPISPMADSAPNLPQFLIEKVLVRLPAISVGRFRCVSKLWRSNLTSPKFTKSHRDFQIHSGARNIIVPVFDLTKYPFFTDQFPYLLSFAAAAAGSSVKVTSPLFCKRVGRFQAIRVLNACHGFALILLNAGMFVFNPVTLEFLEVPRFQYSGEFDKCGSVYGLGFDSSNDDYRIVRLSFFDFSSSGREYDGTYVDVFSLKMKSWRRIANSPYDHFDHSPLRRSDPAAYANGRLHWMALGDDKGYVIAAFNLAREKFEEVPLPPGDFDKNLGEVAVFGEYLAVVHCTSLNDCVEIWVMKEYGVWESWTKLVIDSQGEYRGRFVCLSRDDEIVFRKHGNEFAAYNLSTGVWRDFFVEGIPKGYYDQEVVTTECLLSPEYRSDSGNKDPKSTADFVPEIPQELIDEVLLRLPARSIGQFRCISKLWRSNLSNPKFIRSHFNFHLHRTAPNVIFPPDTTNEYLLTLPADGSNCPLRKVPVAEGTWMIVEAACHGFVLVVVLPGYIRQVLNPITFEYFQLPSHSELPDYPTNEKYGMGYDSCSDDYKIVQLAPVPQDGLFHTEITVGVYSLKMNCWRKVENHPHYQRTGYGGVYINGFLHWVVSVYHDEEDCPDCSMCNVIAAFNLSLEEFEEVPLPEDLPDDLQIKRVAVLRECLAIMCHPSDDCTNIWLMNDYGVQESWEKFEINTEGRYITAVLSLSWEDEFVLVEGSEDSNDRRKLVAYSSLTGIWRDIMCDLPYEFDKAVLTSTECLLSPSCI